MIGAFRDSGVGLCRAVLQLSGDMEDTVVVPPAFRIQEGQSLIDGVVLGRKLGSGLQVTICDLWTGSMYQAPMDVIQT